MENADSRILENPWSKYISWLFFLFINIICVCHDNITLITSSREVVHVWLSYLWSRLISCARLAFEWYGSNGDDYYCHLQEYILILSWPKKLKLSHAVMTISATAQKVICIVSRPCNVFLFFCIFWTLLVVRSLDTNLWKHFFDMQSLQKLKRGSDVWRWWGYSCSTYWVFVTVRLDTRR